MTVTGVVYQGGGIVYTFSDGSVATVVIDIKTGRPSHSVLSSEQFNAVFNFNIANRSALVESDDPRFSSCASVFLNLPGDPDTIPILNSRQMSASGVKITDNNNITVSNVAGTGIKIDTSNPDYGWHDLKGILLLHGIGANEPVYAVYRTPVRAWEFNNVNDELFMEFHVPHDYAPGTIMYVHVHWSHTSASVTSGGVTWGFNACYAKGHNQGAFTDPSTAFTVTQAASTTQYQHLIAETPITNSDGSSGLINVNNVEPDGIIILRTYLSANTISASADPFVHHVDIHYQSTNLPTKAKSPNFYTG